MKAKKPRSKKPLKARRSQRQKAPKRMRGEARAKPGFEGSWMGLAIKLGVSGPTLTKWRKEPGAPVARNLREWTAYATARAGRRKEETMSPKSKAMLRKILAEAEKTEIANAIQKRQWWDASKVKEAINGCVGELKGELNAMKNDLPTMLQGLSIPEMVVVLERVIQGIYERIYGGKLSPVIGKENGIPDA